MEKYKNEDRPEENTIDPKKNNATQEKEYRKDKRKGKIDNAEESV